MFFFLLERNSFITIKYTWAEKTQQNKKRSTRDKTTHANSILKPWEYIPVFKCMQSFKFKCPKREGK